MLVKKSREEVVESRRPLILREKETLVRVLLRCPDLYPTAIEHLKPREHFVAQEEQWLGNVWGAVLLYHKAMLKRADEAEIEPPTAEQIRTYYEKLIDVSNEEDHDEEDDDLAENFIHQVFIYPEKNVERERQQALKNFEYLIHEGVHQKLRDVAEKQDSVPGDLPELLRSMAEAAETGRSISIGKVDLPFPDEEHDTPLIKVATGVKFLDEYMGGGQAGSEVYGFCAPFGVCKTTLAVQLGVERAKYEQARFKKAIEAGEDVLMPFVYLVFYEEHLASVRIRCQSYAGEIERKIIEDRKYDQFSSAKYANYKEYEKKTQKIPSKLKVFESNRKKYVIVKKIWDGLPEAKRAGRKPPEAPTRPDGEKERFAKARSLMNLNLRFIDFTGAKPEYRDAAADMSKGIKLIIEQDQRDNGNPGVSMVVVDYAGAAADRAMELHNYDDSKLRHLIGKMPLRLKNHIAVPYNCPVWLMQQLNADANAKAAGLTPKSTDTAEAKNFFEHVDFGIMVGTQTNEGLAAMRCAKQRREAPRQEVVIKINGLLCRVDDQTTHMLEGHRIVPREEASRTSDIADLPPTAAAKAKKAEEKEYEPHHQFPDE